MSISFTKVTIGACQSSTTYLKFSNPKQLPLVSPVVCPFHLLRSLSGRSFLYHITSPIHLLRFCYTGGVFHVTSPGVWVSPVLCVTPCMGFGAVRGVCVASHLWACVRPPSSVSVLPLVWVSGLYVGSVSRPICGRVCVPRPPCVTPCMGFSAVRGVCVASHLWACVCPPSTV